MNKETVHFLNNIDFESTVEVYEKISSLFEENQELKKQLENTDYTSVYLKGCTDTKGKYLSQQKEFIEYLEDMLDNENDIFSVVRVKDVLSKYKEIIGDDK